MGASLVAAFGGDSGKKSGSSRAGAGGHAKRDDDGSQQRKASAEMKRYFSEWTIDEVQRTFDRITELIAKRTDGSATINRREYYDIFAAGNLDIIKGAKFLSLPLHLFNVFDPMDNGYINLYHMFVVLAMFCSGPVAEKVIFCFSTFDLNKDKLIDRDELHMFVMTCAEALVLMGEISALPPRRMLDKLVDTTFLAIDTDGNGTIDEDEFMTWSLQAKHLTSLVSSIRECDPDVKARREQAARRGRLPGYLQRRWSLSGDDHELMIADAAVALGPKVLKEFVSPAPLDPVLRKARRLSRAKSASSIRRKSGTQTQSHGRPQMLGPDGRPIVAALPDPDPHPFKPRLDRCTRRRCSEAGPVFRGPPTLKVAFLGDREGIAKRLEELRLVNPSAEGMKKAADLEAKADKMLARAEKMAALKAQRKAQQEAAMAKAKAELRARVRSEYASPTKQSGRPGVRRGSPTRGRGFPGGGKRGSTSSPVPQAERSEQESPLPRQISFRNIRLRRDGDAASPGAADALDGTPSPSEPAAPTTTSLGGSDAGSPGPAHHSQSSPDLRARSSPHRPLESMQLAGPAARAMRRKADIKVGDNLRLRAAALYGDSLPPFSPLAVHGSGSSSGSPTRSSPGEAGKPYGFRSPTGSKVGSPLSPSVPNQSMFAGVPGAAASSLAGAVHPAPASPGPHSHSHPDADAYLFSDEAATRVWTGGYPYMKIAASSLSLAAARATYQSDGPSGSGSRASTPSRADRRQGAQGLVSPSGRIRHAGASIISPTGQLPALRAVDKMPTPEMQIHANTPVRAHGIGGGPEAYSSAFLGGSSVFASAVPPAPLSAFPGLESTLSFQEALELRPSRDPAAGVASTNASSPVPEEKIRFVTSRLMPAAYQTS